MITRREFAKRVAAASVAFSSSATLVHALGQSKQVQTEKVEGQKPAFPDWGNHIDPAWVKETLIGGLLDHWLRASVMPTGFIQENLDRDWKSWGTQREASLNGQGRQLYCLARGYELTRRQDYLDAIHRCADFLLKMRDPQYGGFFNRTTPELKLVDDRKTDFTSFAILPLAHIARITGESKYAQEAMKAWQEEKEPDPGLLYGTIDIASSTDQGKTWSEPSHVMGQATPVEEYAPGVKPHFRSKTPYDRRFLIIDQSTGTLYVPGNGSGGDPVHYESFFRVSKDNGKIWGLVYSFDSPEYPQSGVSARPAAAIGVLALAYVASAVPAGSAVGNCPCTVFETSRDEGKIFDRNVVQTGTLIQRGFGGFGNPSLASDPTTQVASPS